jgi:hypothetical protein
MLTELPTEQLFLYLYSVDIIWRCYIFISCTKLGTNLRSRDLTMHYTVSYKFSPGSWTMLSSITFLLQPTHVENVFLSVLPPFNHFVISPSCNLLYITSQFIERAGLPQWQAALRPGARPRRRRLRSVSLSLSGIAVAILASVVFSRARLIGILNLARLDYIRIKGQSRVGTLIRGFTDAFMQFSVHLVTSCLWFYSIVLTSTLDSDTFRGLFWFT